MANYDELFDLVLESTVLEDETKLENIKKDIISLKKDIKAANKSKNIEQMIEISNKIDNMIDEIEKYRKTEVDFDNYGSIDATIKTMRIIENVLKAFATIIPVALLTKGTLDGIKGLKDGTLISKDEVSNLNLNSYEKHPNKDKVVNGVSIAAGIAGAAASELSSEDRRKMMFTYEHTMTTLKKYIDKLKKINKKLKEDIQKNAKTVATESVSELKLEIFESCRSGEITEEERDNLLSML